MREIRIFFATDKGRVATVARYPGRLGYVIRRPAGKGESSHTTPTPTVTTTMNSFHPGESSSHPFREPAPLPTSIPKVNELGATSGPLKSAAFFIGAYCKEFNGGLDPYILYLNQLNKARALQRTSCSARQRIENPLTV